MGGCRCTYKNCTVRSDGGKTHMFHYPVYEKLRCRRWLVNARNLDFFDLSVAQLKNRVICQHHFQEDAFMNCMHNKLKHDAVPTLNGPYCNADELLEDENMKEMLDMDLSQLLIDDIENEVRLTHREKKASSVLKYVDFLTSNDADSITSKPQNPKCLNEDLQNCELATSFMKTDQYIRETRNISAHRIKTPTEKKVTIELEQLFDTIKSEKPKQKSKIRIISEKKITEPPNVSTREMTHVSPSTIINAPKKSLKPTIPTSIEQQASNIWNPKENNLQPFQVIIDNNIQNIDNMPITGNNMQYIGNMPIIDNNMQNIDTMPIVFLDENNTLTSVMNRSATQNEPMLITEQNKHADVKPSVASSPVKKSDSLLKTNSKASPGPKTKIAPERIAAIEEKRNFNKKLRDMIEFCLDELDDPDKLANTTKKQTPTSPVKSAKASGKPSTSNTSSAGTKNDLHTNKKKHVQEDIYNVSSSQVESTPVIQENTLASLEARIAKMEERLAQKIEENSKKITELNDYVTAPESLFCRIPTEHDEVYKKRLYKEISKFLSPDANSLIYEELFIDQFGKKVLEEPTKPKTYTTRSAKRQKRR